MSTLAGITAFLLLTVWAAPSFGSPHFDGLLSATPTGPDSITLDWAPAQQDQNPGGQITYLIYQATQHDSQNYDLPNYITKDTSYRVTGLASNTTYYFVVRAKDQNGQLDSSRVERSAVTFGRWIKKTPATAPPPRLSHSMAYDTESSKVILFGGVNEKGLFFNDVWTYDIINNIWIQRVATTVSLPSPRTVRSLAYFDKQIIVIGGKTSITPTKWSHDAWIYNLENNTWTSAPSPADPSGYGISPQFVYDSANKVVVLFGGWKGTADGHHNILLGEVWEFNVDRGTWTQIFPQMSPSPRTHHAMVYDSINRKVILFGGETRVGKTGEATGRSNETWIYDASTHTWTQMFPAKSPLPRSYHEMAYDSHNQQVILFGGILSSKTQDLTNETWVYNIAANTWVLISPLSAPSPRFHHAMVYDPVGKKVILFGGGTVLCHEPHCFVTTGFVNDTWVYE